MHRGRLLEVDADTAARGVLERLLLASLVRMLSSRLRTGIRVESIQWGRKLVSGALTQKRTLLGGGALEVGNHCLLEDGSERGGALVFDAVVPETTMDGWGHSERALTQKQTLRGGGAPKRGHGAPLEPLAELGDALGGVGAVTLIIEAAELVVIQAAK